MDTYELLLFLHVTCAIVWLGAAMTFGMLSIKAERSGNPMEMKGLSENAQWLTPRLFIPASLLTLVFGILLVLESDFYGFDQLWIVLGLGGFAATFVLGLGFIEPTAKKIDAAIETHGPTSPEAQRLGRRISLLTRFDLVILYAIVAVMAGKPTGDDTLLLVGLAAGVPAAWALVAWLSRPRAEAMPAAVPTE
jgi:uncharacterized membrane protein